ncbi:MAG: 4-(cytidine 5'-diphospho)-2-C-methyl-D-erythritol kinase, partial [Candidatus Eisenbacteria sp.]|nr:4-(cytidine 5'-diphospho)-2-C-methyl-D-erythritol kinase [Candidatus Eisenbacteria bacterium]
DGYHDIETLFQSVSLADTLVLAALEDPPRVSLSVRGIPVPDGPDNLAWRAADAALAEFGCPGVSIDLTKRIPVAAGLGGGSADAAAVLLGVDALFELRTPRDTLLKLAGFLGSDVPFMLFGGTALGTGRGESLEGLPALTGVWFVLATPRFEISAADAYRMARIGLTEPVSFIRVNCLAVREGDIPMLAKGLRNDLEAGVVSACPEVARVKDALLQHGALAAVMSGSGPTVVGLVEDEPAGQSVASRLSGRGWNIHVVAPIDVGQSVTPIEDKPCR